VISGVMEQSNIISVDSFESLLAASKVLSVKRRIKGNRVIIITNGAGAIIQTMGRIGEKDKLKLTELSNKNKNELKNKLPTYAIVGNPIDLTGSGTDADYETVFETVISDPNIDLVLVWFVFQPKTITGRISEILKKYMKKSNKPIICGTIGREYTKRIGNIIERNGVPIFYSVEEWISAAEAICQKN